MGFNGDWFDQNNKAVDIYPLLVKYKDISISYTAVYQELEFQGIRINIKFLKPITSDKSEVVSSLDSNNIYPVPIKELNNELTRYLTKRRRDIIINSIIKINK